MKKLGVAVVGTGFWGRNHARVYSELPGTELVAVCDADAERAERIGAQFGVKAYSDSGRMLRNEAVEAVSVCTWSTALAKEALKALRAGKHVLVEKPMSTHVRQAERLVEMAEGKGLVLTVGFLMRFIPGLQRIREAVARKEIGELVCVSAKRVSQWPERIGDVGVVKDTAIHDIDVVRFVAGADPVGVYAKVGCMRHRRFEDYAQVMLTFGDGKSAFIESNWLTPYKTRSLVVTGSEAIMRLDYITQELWVESARENVQPRLALQEPLKAELQCFADCVAGKTEPLVKAVDGVKALRIAEAALQSSAKNKAVKLD